MVFYYDNYTTIEIWQPKMTAIIYIYMYNKINK